MAGMKIIPLIAAGDAAAHVEIGKARNDVTQLRAELDTEVERLIERVRTTEIAYLDHQAVIDALRLDLTAVECRIARLEVSLPAGKYEARKGVPEG